MAKLVCLTLPYARFPLERGLEGIARAGYRYVGFGWPHQGQDALGTDPNGKGVARARELCEKAGLTPVVVRLGSTAKQPEPIEGRIDVARSLGVGIIQMSGVNSYRKFPDEPLDPNEFMTAHDKFVRDLQAVGPYAEAAGVVLALKPHTGNTATAHNLVLLMADIDRPAVKVCYDPGNIHFYEGFSPEEDFSLIADQTVSIVAKDHRGPRAAREFPIPGQGDVDFATLFAIAQQAGFNGPVVVERVDGTGGPFTAEELDDRILNARQNLEQLLGDAGLELT